jgi:hypothetical protein
MITLKDWMDATGYRVTEGSDYLWNCYSDSAYRLDSWNGEQDGHSASVVFDTRTQEVFEVTVYDYSHNRAYRLINPNYVKLHKEESIAQGASFNQAWDDVDYTDLETDEDMLQKMSSIFSGEEYDTRVQVPLDLEDDLLFDLMKMAHERDITLNQMVEHVLETAIQRHQV